MKVEQNTPVLQETIKGMIVEHIIQVPNQENGHVAICDLKVLTTSGELFTMYGVATPKCTNGSTDSKELLGIASGEAFLRIQSTLEACFLQDRIPQNQAIQQTPLKPSTSILFHSNEEKASSNQKQYRHSPNKPKSEAQAKMLCNMAQERNLDVEKLALDKIGKPFAQLSSQDANTLIQDIKK